MADSASSGYYGTAAAGVNQNPATEKIGGADGFDGSTNAYETLNDGTLPANSPFTLEGWFYLQEAIPDGAYLPIPEKNRDYPSSQDWVGLYAVYDTNWVGPYPILSFGWGSTKGGNLDGTTTLATGKW